MVMVLLTVVVGMTPAGGSATVGGGQQSGAVEREIQYRVTHKVV